MNQEQLKQFQQERKAMFDELHKNYNKQFEPPQVPVQPEKSKDGN